MLWTCKYCSSGRSKYVVAICTYTSRAESTVNVLHMRVRSVLRGSILRGQFSAVQFSGDQLAANWPHGELHHGDLTSRRIDHGELATENWSPENWPSTLHMQYMISRLTNWLNKTSIWPCLTLLFVALHLCQHLISLARGGKKPIAKSCSPWAMAGFGGACQSQFAC